MKKKTTAEAYSEVLQETVSEKDAFERLELKVKELEELSRTALQKRCDLMSYIIDDLIRLGVLVPPVLIDPETKQIASGLAKLSPSLQGDADVNGCSEDPKTQGVFFDKRHEDELTSLREDVNELKLRGV